MMRRRIFLLYLSVSMYLPIIASAQTQNLDDLTNHVSASVTEYLDSTYGAEKRKNDIDFSISNLDSRLQLADCKGDLNSEVKEQGFGSKHFSVKVHCDEKQRWTIYVPVTIKMYAEVAVSTRNLHRGDTLLESDFTFKRTNTANISNSFLDSAKKVTGMELRRAVRAGSILSRQDLKEPTMVKRGETVVIVARTGGLEVRSEGKALSNGRAGEQIRVQNPQSKRVVDARITGRGITEIRL